MPKYYFECKECGNRWTEFWKSINNPPTYAYYCPRCASKNSKKLYKNPPYLNFKGNGFTLNNKDENK